MDLRVPMAPIVAAFGIPITVTRSLPDEAPVATSGVWLSSPDEPQPFGTDLRRREPRRILAVPKGTLTNIPRGSIIVAPEIEGGAAKSWRVDGHESPDRADEMRLILVPSEG